MDFATIKPNSLPDSAITSAMLAEIALAQVADIFVEKLCLVRLRVVRSLNIEMNKAVLHFFSQQKYKKELGPLMSEPFMLSHDDIIFGTKKSLSLDVTSFDFIYFSTACIFGALPGLTSLITRTENGLDIASVSAFAKACELGTLPQLGLLCLNDNDIGNEGMTALASAFVSGALPQLHTLHLEENKIGDEGIGAFALACNSGALLRLTDLNFSCNLIGDDGMAVLSSASMPCLESLTLYQNQIGYVGMECFVAALDRGAMPNLTHLDLQSNKIGTAGMFLFAAAIVRGALPKLSCLFVSQNDAGRPGMLAFSAALQNGALPALTKLLAEWNELDFAELNLFSIDCKCRDIELVL